MTLQPTSPTLSAKSIDEGIKTLTEKNVDTVVSVTDDTHLCWGIGNNGVAIPKFKERLNSQYLAKNYKETGGILISKRDCVTEKTRIGKRVGLLVLSQSESVDIDNYYDWWVAEKIIKRRLIFIRVDGSSAIGLGHIYRCLILAGRFLDDNICFVCDEKASLGIQKIEENHYPYLTVKSDQDFIELVKSKQPDIIINDILDTQADYVRHLKKHSKFIVNFEDLGDGADEADLVINALFDQQSVDKRVFSGPKYFCLRDEFQITGKKTINSKVEQILITFGGTDPNNLTCRCLQQIITAGINLPVTIILGLGFDHHADLELLCSKLDLPVTIHQNVKVISKHFKEADLIFTSCGRTVYEIASIGTPTIVIAQNNREMMHSFACSDNGFENLGLAEKVSDETINSALVQMLGDPKKRANNSAKMSQHNLTRGTERIVNLIFNRYQKHVDPF